MTIIVSYYQPHKAAATLQMDWRLLPFVTVTHTHKEKHTHTRTHTRKQTPIGMYSQLKGCIV